MKTTDHTTLASAHIGRLTKKFIIDFFDTLLFSQAILWDGIDQYNELFLLDDSETEGCRVQQRGALFVQRRTNRALRLFVTASESAVYRVCYRLTGLNSTVKIDEQKVLYHPLEGNAIDVSFANLNLGMQDPSAHSFCDNTAPTGEISSSRLFSILSFVSSGTFITLEDPDLFKDLLSATLSLPPMPSDPHFKPIFGVDNAAANCGN